MKPISIVATRQIFFSSAFACEDADEKKVDEGLEPTVKSGLHQVMVSGYCMTEAGEASVCGGGSGGTNNCKRKCSL